MKRDIYGDVEIELANSTWDFRKEDYRNNMDGIELKQKTKIIETQTFTTLDNVLDKLCLRLTSNARSSKWHKRIQTIEDKVLFLKNELGKTLILASSIKMSNQIHSYFNSKGIKALNSNSVSDSSSQFINDFKNNKDVQILICVGRCSEGFNYPDLENMVDMRCSYSPTIINQQMTRVFRKSDVVKKKLYLRVVNSQMLEDDLMAVSFALSLFHDEYYKEYKGERLEIKKRKIKLIGCIKEKGTEEERVRKAQKRIGKTKVSKEQFVNELPPIVVFEHLNHRLNSELEGYCFTNSKMLKTDFEKADKQKTKETFNPKFTIKDIRNLLDKANFKTEEEWEMTFIKSYEAAVKGGYIELLRLDYFNKG